MSYIYAYPRPALTVDMLIFKKEEQNWKVLLIKRLPPPFKDYWAIPGGFMDENELLFDAAIRELKEETGLTGIHLEQFRVYDAINRDPRHRTISVVFTGIAKDKTEVFAGDDAAEAAWFDIDELPETAFDHAQILKDVIGMYTKSSQFR
jgi:8-oxo-dGTP diphosphatase